MLSPAGLDRYFFWFCFGVFLCVCVWCCLTFAHINEYDLLFPYLPEVKVKVNIYSGLERWPNNSHWKSSADLLNAEDG